MTMLVAMRPLRIPIRIVLYREDGEWVAHCLEFNLVGTGTEQTDAVKVLLEAIGTQVNASNRFRNDANLFSPADGKYFEMFAAGTDTGVGEIKITPIESVAIEPIETREYLDAPDEAHCAFA